VADVPSGLSLTPPQETKKKPTEEEEEEEEEEACSSESVMHFYHATRPHNLEANALQTKN
jgi:transposase-like protein